MDNIHGDLFEAYDDLCAAISDQIDLLAAGNNPEVQLRRARVIRKLAQAVAYLGNPVTVAIDQLYETHPLTTVSADEEPHMTAPTAAINKLLQDYMVGKSAEKEPEAMSVAAWLDVVAPNAIYARVAIYNAFTDDIKPLVIDWGQIDWGQGVAP
jgi:hypothetical protein